MISTALGISAVLIWFNLTSITVRIFISLVIQLDKFIEVDLLDNLPPDADCLVAFQENHTDLQLH